MSVEAVKWAMNDAPMLRTDKGKPDTTARHLLAALAEHAHPNGREAYPAVPLLQWKTGYSRRTVQEALGRLEGAGLIKATGMKRGSTVYALALHLTRPASDKAEISAATEQRRAATAERVRRHRAKDVTPSDSVTVTPPNDVTEPEVTPFDGVRNAVEQRSVTPSDAPKPSVEPSGKSLSPHLPQQTRDSPAAPGEREINGDEQMVLAAYAAALGRKPTTAVAQKIRDQAGKLIADGLPAWWIADRARELVERGWTDLAKHCDMSAVPVEIVRPADEDKPCTAHSKFSRMIPDPSTGDLVNCPACHPDELARRRRQGAA